MKITKIRWQHPVKDVVLSDGQIEEICTAIRRKINEAGFITDVTPLTYSSIKVGMHMCSFRIDPTKRGYNADTGFCGSRCKAGFKRTTIPTWDQRKEFNHIVNDVLDEFFVSANVKSGDLTVRSFAHGRINNWHAYQTQFGDRCFYEISTIKEVVESKWHKTRLMLIQGGAA